MSEILVNELNKLKSEFNRKLVNLGFGSLDKNIIEFNVEQSKIFYGASSGRLNFIKYVGSLVSHCPEDGREIFKAQAVAQKWYDDTNYMQKEIRPAETLLDLQKIFNTICTVHRESVTMEFGIQKELTQMTEEKKVEWLYSLLTDKEVKEKQLKLLFKYQKERELDEEVFFAYKKQVLWAFDLLELKMDNRLKDLKKQLEIEFEGILK